MKGEIIPCNDERFHEVPSESLIAINKATTAHIHFG